MSFSPQHNIPQRDKFRFQLGLIKLAFTKSTIVLGDFNLDWGKRFDAAYSHKNYFEVMEEFLGHCNLNQLVDVPTWSRTINERVKESTLDHVHIVNPCDVTKLILIS